jgi:hypothetical protein
MSFSFIWKESRPHLSVPQLLAEVRSLPFEAAAQVAKVALETMVNKGEAKAC